MKREFPPEFHHIGPKRCASCANLMFKELTDSYFCVAFSITFPTIESSKYYSCNAHDPVRGVWKKLIGGEIVIEGEE